MNFVDILILSEIPSGAEAYQGFLSTFPSVSDRIEQINSMLYSEP